MSKAENKRTFESVVVSVSGLQARAARVHAAIESDPAVVDASQDAQPNRRRSASPVHADLVLRLIQLIKDL